MNIKFNIRAALRYFVLICICIFILTPIVIVVITSFKDKAEFFGNPIYKLPEALQFENFKTAFFGKNMLNYIKNSLVVTVIKVPIGVYLAALTAFGLTRLNLKHPTAWFILFLTGMMIPQQLLLIPINIILKNLNLLNTYTGLILVYTGCGLSFGILVMRGCFRGIPAELDEAATIDGCSWIATFHRVVLPVSKPALSTLIIMNSVNTWNEYLLSSIIISRDQMRTVTTGLMHCVDEATADYGVLSAAVLISLVPLMIVYLLFQRYFIEGMTGAVKG